MEDLNSLVILVNLLEQANRKKQRQIEDLENLAGTVTHELKTPLAIIISYINLVREGCYGPINHELKPIIEKIRSNGLYMDSLIKDLTQDALANTTDLSYEEVNLTEMAREIQQVLQGENSGNARFKVQEGLYAKGDKRLLKIVLTNLVGNAIKYSSKQEQPLIELGIKSYDGIFHPNHKDEKAYCISDNGSGFDMSQADRLFKRFERLHTTEFPGTGIGLSTVKRIIERHNGSIWAESKPGEGATFYFTLPSKEK